MKNYIKLFLSTAVAGSMLLSSSCKKGEDLYTNPNNPSEVTPSLILTALEVSTFNSYEGGLVKNASIFMQQNVGVNEQSLQANRYIINEQDFDNSWGQLYQAMYSAKDLQNNFGGENPYYSGITDILMAMNLGLATDLWGDVPYSDALQGASNPTPLYDAQEQVLNTIVSLLDGAIAKLAEPEAANTFLPGADDLVFGGNVTAWTKVAWTLKARYLNRFSNKSNYNTSEILTCLSNGIQSGSDDLISVHGTASNEYNNWYDFQNNRPGYILASQPFLDSIMLRPTDVRYAYYYDTTGGVIGSPVDEVDAAANQWGPYLAASPATGIRLVSFVEAKFIEAEVKARLGAADAADVLNAAIMASCSDVTGGTYDGADIATYSGAIDVSRVIYEKWIALFGSAEPYNDYRRTGFPALTPNPAGLINVIPKRNLTPQAERINNPNAPTPALTDAVWYAL